MGRQRHTDHTVNRLVRSDKGKCEHTLEGVEDMNFYSHTFFSSPLPFSFLSLLLFFFFLPMIFGFLSAFINSLTFLIFKDILMWTIFKVFTEFVTTLFLFFGLDIWP